MNDRRAQIEERLDQGEAPTEAEVRWLIASDADKEQTIRLLTDAAIDLLHTWIETTDLTQRPGFDDHARQFVDK